MSDVLFRSNNNRPIQFVLIGLNEQERGMLTQKIVARGGTTAQWSDTTTIAFTKAGAGLSERKFRTPVIISIKYVDRCIENETLLPLMPDLLQGSINPETRQKMDDFIEGIAPLPVRRTRLLSRSLENLGPAAEHGMVGSRSEAELNARYVREPIANRRNNIRERIPAPRFSAHVQYTFKEKQTILRYIADNNLYDNCHGLTVFETMIANGIINGRTPGAVYNKFRKIIKYELNFTDMTFGLAVEEIRKFKAIPFCD